MIEIKNVSKTYKQASLEVKAIQDVTLNLPSKGIIFVVGKSGCGKSTFLNVLGGLDSFDNGDIIIENKSMKDFKETDYNKYRNSYVGFVFQDFNLIDDYNVEKNIALGTNITDKLELNTKITEVLKKVDLEGFEKRKPNTLSGGQKQRVAIARAMIKNPKILLCDEPTGQLDFETGESIFKLLKEISKENLVLIVSHDIDAATNYADRIIRLQDGKITSDNKPETVDSVNDFELKEYHLPTKSIINIAFEFLKPRPIRLFIAMMISFVVFFLFCMSDIIGSYDRNKAVVDMMHKNNNDYIMYYKQVGWKRTDEKGNEKEHALTVYMDDEDIKFLTEKLDINEYDIIYPYFEGNEYNLDLTGKKINTYYYQTDIAGMAEISEEFLTRYGYSLYGELPKTDNEVVLTKYAYEMYHEFGYVNDTYAYEIKEMSDLIGKTIKLSCRLPKLKAEKEYKIVGIVDTKFNNKRYEKILTTKYGELVADYNRELEFFYMENSFHNLIFLKEGFYEDYDRDLTNLLDLNTFSRGNFCFEALKKKDVPNLKDEIDKFENAEKMQILSNIDNLNIDWKDEPLTKLTGNQILLPISCITERILKRTIEDQILEYADSTYEEVKDMYATRAEYETYLLKNEYQKFRDMLYSEKAKQALETYESFKLKGSIYNESGSMYQFDQDVEVVGFYNDYDDNVFETSFRLFYVSEVFFNDFVKGLGDAINDYYKVAVPLTGNYRKDLKLVNFTNQKINKKELIPGEGYADYYQFEIENEITYLVDDTSDYLETTIKIFKYFTPVALLLVIFFISFYFSGVIIDKEKEIGILRALGSSKKDIIKIFFSACFVMSLISILLSVVASIISIGYFNQYLVEKFHLIQPIYYLGIRQVIIIFFTQIIIFVVGIIYPLIKLLKKKPVDIISKR